MQEIRAMTTRWIWKKFIRARPRFRSCTCARKERFSDTFLLAVMYLTAARSSWRSAPRNEFFYIIALRVLRHTAHFRWKLGRARRERDLPQPAPELTRWPGKGRELFPVFRKLRSQFMPSSGAIQRIYERRRVKRTT